MTAQSRRYANPRLDHPTNQQRSNAIDGTVRTDHSKVLFMGTMYLGTLVALLGYLDHLDAIIVFVLGSGLTLLGGHSLGMHRLFIHRAWTTPRWLANSLLYLGTLVGMGGPLTMLATHDLRDWAQRQQHCHDFFAHRRSIRQDFYWQIFCRLDLVSPPSNQLEADYATWRFAHWLERTAHLQQLILALVLFGIGGLPWVLWGVCARVAVSVTGHWLIGYFAHNEPQPNSLRKRLAADRIEVRGACTQGFNVPLVSLLCFGENWHNNHHAWPGSARLGVHPGELDPGWWVLQGLQKLGLADNLVTPDTLPARAELEYRQTDLNSSPQTGH